MDWADAIAAKLLFNHDESEVKHNEIATALRKAKADGMRDATDEFEACGGYYTPSLMAAMRKQADEIEKGTP